MIRVQRGSEPAALKVARKWRLAAARTEHATTGRVRAQTLTGYKNAAAGALHVAQHGKCAWCEEQIRLGGAHVEHYRPKTGAWRHSRGEVPQVDPHCYWWLAWTWENLLLSCGTCNDPAHKGNYFPLDPRPRRRKKLATVWPRPRSVGRESPLLIDPASGDPAFDPLNHIEWRPVDQVPARKHWQWTPSPLSSRGATTVRVLRLDVQLVDIVGDHLRGAVLDAAEEVEEHHAAGRVAEANRGWSTLLSTHLGPRARYRAATWCALRLWKVSALGLVAPLVRP